MKAIKIILFIMLAINSSNILAKKDIEYVKENNNVIQIGTRSIRFEQPAGELNIFFRYSMSLELYSNKFEKQYALKFSVPLKKFIAFKTNSEVIFNLTDNQTQSLLFCSTYTFNDKENSYIIIPITSNDIEVILKGFSSIQFDFLYYDYDDIKQIEKDGVKEGRTIQEFKSNGKEKSPGRAFKPHSFTKELAKLYESINMEFEKIKAQNFIIDYSDYKK